MHTQDDDDSDVRKEKSLLVKRTEKMSSNIERQLREVRASESDIKSELLSAREAALVRPEPAQHAAAEDVLQTARDNLEAARTSEELVADNVRDQQMRASAAKARDIVRIELRPLSADSLHEYFRRARDAGEADPNFGHPFEGSMALGSQLQQIRADTPGAVMPVENHLARARRLDAAATQKRWHSTVLDMQATAYYKSVAAAAAMTREIRSTYNVGVTHIPEHLLAVLEEQINQPFDLLPMCNWREKCTAVTHLAPLPDGTRSPLVAYQTPQDFIRFINSGTIMSSVRGQHNQLCIPCLIFMFGRQCMTKIQCDMPCSDVPLPFTFAVNRPGGIKTSAAIQHQTMPGAFMQFIASHFVPTRRVIHRTVIDELTHATHKLSTTVMGYAFCEGVRYAGPCSTSHLPAIGQAMPLYSNTLAIKPTSLFEALRMNIEAHPQVVAHMALSEKSAAAVCQTLELLCCEFSSTLQQIERDTDCELFERNLEFMLQALALFGIGQLRRAGVPDTICTRAQQHSHGIALALLWRIGFTEAYRNNMAMHECENIRIYLDTHLKLSKELDQKFSELKHLPSNEELCGGARNGVRCDDSEYLCVYLNAASLYPASNLLPTLSAHHLHKVMRSAPIAQQERLGKPMHVVRRVYLGHLPNAPALLFPKHVLATMSQMTALVHGQFFEW